MSYLYLLLNVSSISVPFLASFHPRLKFYKKWNHLFVAMLIINFIFISWDIWFTKIGVWGFNPDYLIGFNILNLPIEEWLFFICIPYACVFMHYAIIELQPTFCLPTKITFIVSAFLLIGFVLIAILNYNKLYTVFNYGLAFIVLILVNKFHAKLLCKFYVTFSFMLIPFFIINGILTGTGIAEEVVWYNDSENLGIKILTIPFEDITYAFTLILATIFFMEKLPLARHLYRNEINNNHN